MLYFTPPDSNDSLTRLVLNNKEYVFHFGRKLHSPHRGLHKSSAGISDDLLLQDGRTSGGAYLC